MKRIPNLPPKKKKATKKRAPGRNSTRAGRSRAPRTQIGKLKKQIDKLLQKTSGLAPARVAICNHLYSIYKLFLEANGGDEKKARAAYHAWCFRTYDYHDRWADMLLEIGAALTPSQVRGKDLCYHKLHVIAKAQEIYRPLLIRHGHGCTKEQLNEALDIAMGCRTDEEALAVLKQALTAPPEAAQDSGGRGNKGRGNRPARLAGAPPRTVKTAMARAARLGTPLGLVMKQTWGLVKQGKRPTPADRLCYAGLRTSLLSGIDLLDEVFDIQEEGPTAPEDTAPSDRAGGRSPGEAPPDGDRRTRKRSGHRDTPDARSGQDQGPAATPGPAPSSLQTPPAADAAAQTAPAVLPNGPVQRPHLGPAERAIPVPFPGGNPNPNPADLHAASLIVLFSHAADEALAVDFYRDYPHKLHLDAPLPLHYLLWQQACGFYGHYQDLGSALESIEEPGKAFLLGLLPSYPDSTLEEMYPISTDWQEGDRAMAWVVWQELDPTHTRHPNELERPMVRLLGLYRAIDKSIKALFQAVDDGHLMTLDMGYQLLMALRQMYHHAGFIQGEFCRGAKLFEEQLAEHARTAEQRAAFRAQMESRIIMLGSDRISAQYVIIGVTPQGIPVAIDLNTAQVVAMLGGQGWGKSYLQTLIREACHLRLDGINRLIKPIRTLTLSAAWELGQNNLQFLRGFDPNPDPAQWDYLRHMLAADVDQEEAAFKRMLILCLPGMEAYYHKALPDLVQRGLEITPALQSEEEMAANMAMLLGVGTSSGEKPRHIEWLEAELARLGREAVPRRLIEEVKKARMDHRAKGALLKKLALLDRMTTDKGGLWEVLKDDVPLWLLFESDYMPRDLLLPLQLSVASTLCRKLRELGLQMWIFLDELGKYAMSQEAALFFKRLAAEVRHGLISLCAGGQTMADLPPGFAALTMNSFLFNVGAPQELQKWREMMGGYQGVRHERVMEMEAGDVLFRTVRSNHREVVQKAQFMYLRPSCVDAGGESVRAVEEETDWGEEVYGRA